MPTLGITVADGSNFPVCRTGDRVNTRLLLAPRREQQQRAIVPLTIDGQLIHVLTVAQLPEGDPTRELELVVQIDADAVLSASVRPVGAAFATTSSGDAVTVQLDAEPDAKTESTDVPRIRALALSGYVAEEAVGQRYRPATTVAALRAFEHGIAPLEVFIHLATSAKAMNVPPFDLEPIRQLLSQADPGLPTTLRLMGIFRTLVLDDDLEVALFAAEAMKPHRGVTRRRRAAAPSGLPAAHAPILSPGPAPRRSGYQPLLHVGSLRAAGADARLCRPRP